MNTFLRTLIIDDEERAIIDLEYLLKNHKTIKVVAHEKDSEKAVQVIENFRPDLIFLDIHMPGKTGFEITDEIFKMGLSLKLSLSQLSTNMQLKLSVMPLSTFYSNL